VVSVDVHPWAEVSVGDRSLGRTPFAPLSLEPGEVVFVFQHPAFWPLRRHVVLESGRRTDVQVDLQWEAVPRGKVPPYRAPSGPSPRDPAFGKATDFLVLGDFPKAVSTLRPLVLKLGEEGRPKELARAEFFLGVALLESGQEMEARRHLEAALAHDPSLEPEPAAFPARVSSFFGHVRSAVESDTQ
jgi:hypothetical protein